MHRERVTNMEREAVSVPHLTALYLARPAGYVQRAKLKLADIRHPDRGIGGSPAPARRGSFSVAARNLCARGSAPFGAAIGLGSLAASTHRYRLPQQPHLDVGSAEPSCRK